MNIDKDDAVICDEIAHMLHEIMEDSKAESLAFELACEQLAARLGFLEHLHTGGCGGRTWDGEYSSVLNDAYDRGMNEAEANQ